MRHVLSATQFDLSFLARLCKRVAAVQELQKSAAGKRMLLEILRGFTVLVVSYPPSTRTVHQSVSAAGQLGAIVVTERGLQKDVGNDKIVWELPFSSEVKGERFEDTILALASAYQLLILRHFEECKVFQAAKVLDEHGSKTRIVNAGDGPGEHPMQALIDLLAIFKFLGCAEKPDFDLLRSVSIAFVGDNKAGRTVHSLARLLGPLGVHMHFVSPEILALPQEYRDEFRERGYECTYLENPEPVQMIYLTRINVTDYSWELRTRLKGAAPLYCMTPEIIRALGVQAIFHPFPRQEELPVEVDAMPQAQYFSQMELGVPVRMALLWEMLAPEIEEGDLQQYQWAESFTKQCMCGKVFSTILGWAERPQPYSRYLPKVAICPYCEPRRDGQIIHV